MRLLVATLLLSFAAPALAEEPAEPFKLIDAAALQAQLKAKDSKVALFDANAPDFRRANGVIPGATLLSSGCRYDIASELPADKGTPLVFYCANKH